MNQRKVRFHLLFLACFISFFTPGWSQSILESVLGRIDARMQQAEKKDGFSGIVFVGQGGRILFDEAYGWADPVDGYRNNHEKRFMIASLSKSFVAASILQLEDRGLLSVEDHIGKYIEEYPAWAANNITIHQLLNHTSGIPDYINDFPIEFKIKQISNWVPDTDELIESFKFKPLNFYPGTDFKYSNSGYVLLAKIVENVTGMEYGKYLYQNILDPLGMKNTGLGDFDLVGNRAFAHKTEGGRRKLVRNFKNEWIYGMGEMYSTAPDLNKWLNSFSGNLILSEEAKTKMFDPISHNYGYGWHVNTIHGRIQYSHGGYLPGWNSFVYFYPEDTLSVIVLSNMEETDPMEICEAISGIYFRNGLDQVPFSEQEVFAGRYEFLDEPETAISTPFESEIVTVNEEKGSINVKTPIGETLTFTRKEENTWKDPDEDMEIHFRESGGMMILQLNWKGQQWKWRKLSGEYRPAGGY